MDDGLFSGFLAPLDDYGNTPDQDGVLENSDILSPSDELNSDANTPDLEIAPKTLESLENATANDAANQGADQEISFGSGSNYGCGGCDGLCYRTCLGSCEGSCAGSCEDTCSGTCRWGCLGSR